MKQVENWSAFRKGCEACQKFNSDPSKAKNPYSEGTNKYYGWNQGWNSHKEE